MKYYGNLRLGPLFSKGFRFALVGLINRFYQFAFAKFFAQDRMVDPRRNSRRRDLGPGVYIIRL
jgi:hypothetical protein